jgi:hypothetical protein
MTDFGRRVVTIGASPAGLRCASRLARLKPAWHITVVEAQESFSYAACGLPYVLSGDITPPDAPCRTADGALGLLRVNGPDPLLRRPSVTTPSRGKYLHSVWYDLALGEGLAFQNRML